MEFKRFLAAVSAAAVVCLLLLTSCSSKDDPGAASSPSGPASETPAASGTAGLLAQIQDKGQLTIALEGTWAPWGYHDEDGQLVGYDVEIGRAIAEKLGVEPVFAEGEWSGLLAGLEAGRYDVMINGMDVDEDRRQKYDFSTPYAYNRTVVIVRADDDSIQSMEDLKGKLTANTLQSTYAAVGERYGAQVTGVDDFIQTIELLTDRRIDATLNADVSFSDYMAQHPDAPIKIACTDPDASQVAIPMPKGADSDALRAAIDKALGELAADGTLTGLSLKYFGLDISKGG